MVLTHKSGPFVLMKWLEQLKHPCLGGEVSLVAEIVALTWTQVCYLQYLMQITNDEN